MAAGLVRFVEAGYISTVASDPESLRPEPRREPSFQMSTRQLGMNVFLLSLGVLFVASIAAYLLTRFNHPAWRETAASLPLTLLASGAFLLGTSLSFEQGLRAIRRNDQQRLRLGLVLAGVFSAAFLVGQCLNWVSMLRLNSTDDTRLLSLFVFYMLTALHALHVVGGFIPLAITLHRAYQREYSSSRLEGVKLCAQYWHFLGLVWVVLMAVMFAT